MFLKSSIELPMLNAFEEGEFKKEERLIKITIVSSIPFSIPKSFSVYYLQQFLL